MAGIGVVVLICLVLGFNIRSGWQYQTNLVFEANGVPTSDQIAYLTQAGAMYSNPDHIVLDRERGPVIAALAASNPIDSDLGRLDHGIRANECLSACVLLAIVLTATRVVATSGRSTSGRLLSAPISLVALGLWSLWVASSFGVFYASWLTADLLGSLMFTLCGVMAVRLLVHSTPWFGFLFGLICGIAYLTKPIVAPLLVWFAAAAMMDLAWRRFRDPSNIDVFGRATAAAGALLGFVGVTAGYMANSAKQYGSPFYNVNTSYYMWYDSLEESVGPNGIWTHFGRVGRPDLPPSQLPSAANYLRTHNLGAILERLWHGFLGQFRVGPVAVGVYDYGHIWPVAVLLVVGLFVAVVLRSRVYQAIRRNPPMAIFIIGSLLTTELSICWWLPLSHGTRFVLPLILPVSLLLVVAIAAATKGLTIPVANHRISVHSALATVALIGVLLNSFWVSAVLAPQVLGGV